MAVSWGDDDPEGDAVSVHDHRALDASFASIHRTPRFMGIVTPGGLHEKLLAGLGESAKTETLPPPPEGPPDVARIAQIVRKYDTEILPPLRQ